LHEAVSQHVDGDPGLFEWKIPQEWFELAVHRLHVDERDVTMNGAETLDLDAYRTTDCGLDRALIGRLHLDVIEMCHAAETFTPGGRQNEEAGSCIYESVETDEFCLCFGVRSPYLRDDASHRRKRYQAVLDRATTSAPSLPLDKLPVLCEGESAGNCG
jgi:hypothetical protein